MIKRLLRIGVGCKSWYDIIKQLYTQHDVMDLIEKDYTCEAIGCGNKLTQHELDTQDRFCEMHFTEGEYIDVTDLHIGDVITYESHADTGEWYQTANVIQEDWDGGDIEMGIRKNCMRNIQVVYRSDDNRAKQYVTIQGIKHETNF